MFTQPAIEFDTLNSGFLPNSKSNLVLKVRISNTSTPANAERPNYPADYLILFSDVVVDTSIASVGVPSVFTKFKIMGLPKSGGESQFDFRFFDSDGNQTISRNDEYIDILTRNSAGVRLPVWRVTVDTRNNFV